MNIYKQISRNRFKTYLIIFFFIAFISLVFYLIGEYYQNPTTFFAIGILLSLVSGIGSYFFSDKIVLSMSGAKPAKKEEYFDFYTVAENLSIASGLPMPKLYVINDNAPNAFATGRDPKHAVVVATNGLLKQLDRAEIEGVISHELSHIKNYDILLMSIVTVLVGTLVFAIDWITRSMWWGGSGRDNKKGGGIGAIILILTLIITPIIASLVQLSISRKREYLADASGALLTRNPKGLASALNKIASYPRTMARPSNATAHLYISNPFGGKGKAKTWISKLFSTHPPIEERVRILLEM